jgi:hypothetical protein
MRLARVPALKALDTTEFYHRCDVCDYSSEQLTGVSGEFACDIHQQADCKLKPSDLIAWCEREVAILVRASSGTAQLPIEATVVADQDTFKEIGCRLAAMLAEKGIPSVGSLDDGLPTGASNKLDRPVPAPSLPQPAYTWSGVATFLVISAIAAWLASYVGSSPPSIGFLTIPTFGPSELPSLAEAEEPSIKSEATTTGSANEQKARMANLQPMTLSEKTIHSEKNSIDTGLVPDSDNRIRTGGAQKINRPHSTGRRFMAMAT